MSKENTINVYKSGTVIIDWQDGGQSVLDYNQSKIENRNVWHVRFDDGKYVRDFSDHSNFCNDLLAREMVIRLVEK